LADKKSHIHLVNEPVTLLQFGTGMLLRGLVDEIIYQAKQTDRYSGKIGVVKSTPGSVSVFAEQQNQYTVFVTGQLDGHEINTCHQNNSIAHVWQAEEDWEIIMETAASENVTLIVSNTTEAGLVYKEEIISDKTPASFPAKLTALLYNRYKRQNHKRLLVIATELLERNGEILHGLVLRQAKENRLPAAFLEWIENNIGFCNSLVDRIVTRAPKKLTDTLNYTDPLAIQTEPYYLWAIECKKDDHYLLPFAENNTQVILSEKIDHWREQKLRLLNGIHTFIFAKAYLTYANTVYDLIQDEDLNRFTRLLMEEILLTFPEKQRPDRAVFAQLVLERFSNPYLQHKLLDISFEATAKMRYRNLPSLERYYQHYRKLPVAMVSGFAWYLLFMKSIRKEGNKFIAGRNGDEYVVNDRAADFYYYLWQNLEENGDWYRFALQVCKNEALWGKDLSQLPGFAEAVTEQLQLINTKMSRA
jgi:tagaturonate reductase